MTLTSKEEWVSGENFTFETPGKPRGRVSLAGGNVRSPINTRRRTTMILGKIPPLTSTVAYADAESATQTAIKSASIKTKKPQFTSLKQKNSQTTGATKQKAKSSTKLAEKSIKTKKSPVKSAKVTRAKKSLAKTETNLVPRTPIHPSVNVNNVVVKLDDIVENSTGLSKDGASTRPIQKRRSMATQLDKKSSVKDTKKSTTHAAKTDEQHESRDLSEEISPPSIVSTSTGKELSRSSISVTPSQKMRDSPTADTTTKSGNTIASPIKIENLKVSIGPLKSVEKPPTRSRKSTPGRVATEVIAESDSSPFIKSRRSARYVASVKSVTTMGSVRKSSAKIPISVASDTGSEIVDVSSHIQSESTLSTTPKPRRKSSSRMSSVKKASSKQSEEMLASPALHDRKEITKLGLPVVTPVASNSTRKSMTRRSSKKAAETVVGPDVQVNSSATSKLKRKSIAATPNLDSDMQDDVESRKKKARVTHAESPRTPLMNEQQFETPGQGDRTVFSTPDVNPCLHLKAGHTPFKPTSNIQDALSDELETPANVTMLSSEDPEQEFNVTEKAEKPSSRYWCSIM